MKKTKRLELRASSEAHELVKKAAELRNLSISAFVLQAAQDAAEKVITSTAVLDWCLEDRLNFAKAIVDPPAPDEALKRAFQRRKELIIDD